MAWVQRVYPRTITGVKLSSTKKWCIFCACCEVLEQIAITGVLIPPCTPTLLILCKINFNVRIPGVLNDKTLFTLSGIITFRKTASSEDQALFAKALAPSGVLQHIIVPESVKSALSKCVCMYVFCSNLLNEKLNAPRIQSGHLSCKVIRYHERTNASIDLRCRASAKSSFCAAQSLLLLLSLFRHSAKSLNAQIECLPTSP